MRNVRKLLLGILVWGSLVCSVWSQRNVEFSKNNFPGKETQFKQAKKYLGIGNRLYKKALKSDKTTDKTYIDILQKFYIPYELNPDNADLNFKMGYCLRMLGMPIRSFDFFNFTYQVNASFHPALPLYLAEGHHHKGEWDKATKLIEVFLKQPVNEQNSKYRVYAEKVLEECKNAKKIAARPIRARTENAGVAINSIFPDMHPFVSADDRIMIFTSTRDTILPEKKSKVIRVQQTDIFYSTRSEAGWSAAQPIPGLVNTTENEYAAGISDDGQWICLVRVKKADAGDLYESYLDERTWTEPAKLSGGVNSIYRETMASITYDRRRIYFISDRPGGMGGLDIWYCDKEESGNWGAAVNLGPEVNTPLDENSVMVFADAKTIYFSSDGHTSMGGADIFKTRFENGKWSKPANLGFPINTPGDELSFSITASGRKAYYAPKREDAVGAEDIYAINLLGPEKQPVMLGEDQLIATLTTSFPNIQLNEESCINCGELYLITGHVNNGDTTQPIRARMFVADNGTGRKIIEMYSNGATGYYLFSLPAGRHYGIYTHSAGYIYASENLQTNPGDPFKEIHRDVKLEPILPGKKGILKNIFFESGHATLLMDSYTELGMFRLFLEQNPNTKIALKVWNLPGEKKELRKKLELERTQKIINFLVDNGISKDRLSVAQETDFGDLPKEAYSTVSATHPLVQFVILEP